MIKVEDKNERRKVRHERVRRKISGTPSIPRLNVYRSLTGIYAQIIDDENGCTLVSASSKDKELAKSIAKKSKTEQAKLVGKAIAKKALDKKITNVVFDRGGYIYTGRVQALAEAAREAGLKF